MAGRSARFALANASNIWASSFEFKAAAALLAALEFEETGDASVARDAWADSDAAINADAHPLDYLALPFLAGVRYAAAGGGLLVVPADCGGAWGCDALVDWPTQTRDGYVVSNSDAIRNGIGAAAARALAALAAALG